MPEQGRIKDSNGRSTQRDVRYTLVSSQIEVDVEEGWHVLTDYA
jgi:hypothetical protein